MFSRLSAKYLWEVLFMNKKKSPYVIAYSALLIAIEIVLNRFCSINTMGWKIGFGFVPIVIAAAMFGSVTAAVVYGLSDLIGALLFPIGAYFPGFTVSAAIMGAVYGLFLYKKTDDKKISFFPNVIVPVLFNNIVIGLLLNTMWVSILYGSKTYWGWFLYRLPEYAILIPLGCVLIPILVRLCDKLRKMVYR